MSKLVIQFRVYEFEKGKLEAFSPFNSGSKNDCVMEKRL